MSENLNIDELNEQPEMSEKEKIQAALDKANGIIAYAYKEAKISKAPGINLSEKDIDNLILNGADLSAVLEIALYNISKHAAILQKSLPKGKVRDMKLRKKNLSKA